MGRISKRVGRVAKVAASTQAAAASAWDESPQGSRTVETSAPPAALVINMCLCLSLKNKGNGTAHFGAPLWARLRNACFLGHGMTAQGSLPSRCCGPGRRTTYAFASRTLAGPGCATQRRAIGGMKIPPSARRHTGVAPGIQLANLHLKNKWCRPHMKPRRFKPATSARGDGGGGAAPQANNESEMNFIILPQWREPPQVHF